MAKKVRIEIDAKDNASKKVKKFTSESSSAFKKLAGAAGVAAATAAITALARETLRYGDQLGKLNQRLGISVESLDKLRKIGEKSGVSFNALSTSLQRMSRRIAEAAKGQGEAVNTLDQLGLSAQKLSRLPLDEQFRIIAERLNMVNDDGQKLAMTFKLMDTEGAALIPMFADISKNMAETNSQFTPERVKQIEAFNDQMTDLKNILMDIAVNVMPPLLDLLNQFSEWMNKSPVSKEIEETQAAIDNLTKQIEIAESGGNNLAVITGTVDEWREKREALQAYLNDIKALQVAVQTTASSTGGGRRPDVSLGKGQSNKPKGTSGSKSGGAADVTSGIDNELNKFFEWYESEQRIHERAQEDLRRHNETLDEIFADMDQQVEDFHQKQKEAMTMVSTALVDPISQAFGELIAGTESFEDAFRKMIASMLQNLSQLLLNEAFQTFIGSLSNSGQGGDGSILGAIGSIFGGLFSSGAAGGGGIDSPTLVGEKGPEIFVPHGSGRVIPNNQIGGSGQNVSINTSVTIEGNVNNREDAEYMTERISNEMRGMIINELKNQMRPDGVISRERRQWRR